jgi:hypothetical protein
VSCLPNRLSRLLVVAAIAGLALVQLPAASRADDSAPPAEEGPRTVVKYVTCAGSLALANNLYTAFVAFMMCAKMFTEEMTP